MGHEWGIEKKGEVGPDFLIRIRTRRRRRRRRRRFLVLWSIEAISWDALFLFAFGIA